MGRVMIVDDTPQYLELMATLLSSHGHSVIALSQVLDAVETVESYESCQVCKIATVVLPYP